MQGNLPRPLRECDYFACTGQVIGNEMTRKKERGIGRKILGDVVAQEKEVVIMGGVMVATHMTEIGDIEADPTHERENVIDQDRLNGEEDTGTSVT